MANEFESVSIPKNRFEDVYRDTMYFIDAIVNEYDFYDGIMKMISAGANEFEIKSRNIKKTIDETWIVAIESAIPALDTAIRNPSRFLEEKDDVLPIELSRNISNRSLRHLAQHSDYISKVEGDTITPSKILNVFRDETIMTYENKFLNTLIKRLYLFVEQRYNQMCNSSSKDSTTKLEITSEFNIGEKKGKFNFGIEVQEDAEQVSNGTSAPVDNSDKPTETQLSLTERVEKLHSVCKLYYNSKFAKSLGNATVRPPIVRTNAILKNKNLKECLALWEFISSYTKIGYKIDIEETAKAPDETYIRELYAALALQYVVFQYNIKNNLDIATIAEKDSEDAIEPRFVTNFKPIEDEEFDIVKTEKGHSPYQKNNIHANDTREREREVIEAVDAAMAADKFLKAKREAEEKERQRIAELEARAKAEAEEARQRAIERAEKLKAAEQARKEKRKAELAAQRLKQIEKRKAQRAGGNKK